MRITTNKLVSLGARYVTPAVLAAGVMTGAVVLLSHSAVHAAAISAAPLDDRSISALTTLDQAMEAVAARVTPAVVNIAVTSAPSPEETAQEEGNGRQALPPGFDRFFGRGGSPGDEERGRGQEQPLQHAIGSGVIISPDGYIVTNNHVVEGAKQIRVTLHDRRILAARVVGTDKLTDLAVVKVDARDLPAITWGNSAKLEPGQTVLAFGSPFGYFQFSVTRGIVSAVNRDNPYRDDARKPGGYIQTDAAINPGNSGGALVNAHGELVGINTFIATASGSFAGAGFAIPSQLAENVSQQIIAHGKVDHGYLGLSLNDVTPDNAHFFNLQDASGAIVADVAADSPARQAGLNQGDVIVTINGQKVLNGSALQVAVSEIRPGTSVMLGVIRDGKTRSMNVTVGQYQARETEVAKSEGTLGTGSKLGLAVTDVTPDVQQQLNLPANVKGAVVEKVRPASPAEEAGIQPGDVILEVDRRPTTSANQFVGAVHSSAAGKDLLLLVWSRGNASYRTVRPEASPNNG